MGVTDAFVGLLQATIQMWWNAIALVLWAGIFTFAAVTVIRCLRKD